MRARHVVFLLLAPCGCVGDSAPPPPSDGGPDGTVDAPADVAVDASDGATADVSDAPFDPIQLPGLALWLKGDDALHSGTNVTSWPDGSNNHNDATASATQPQFVASALNGHAVVRFGGSSYLSIADSASLGFGSSGANPFVLEAVVTYPVAVNGSLAVFSKMGTSGTGPLMMIGSTGSTQTTVSGQVDTEAAVFANWILTTGSMRIMLQWAPNATPPGGILSARAGNSTAAQKTLANATSIATSKPAYVGAVDFGSGPDASTMLKADIAELVLFSPSTVDPNDVVKLENYLNKKYGL